MTTIHDLFAQLRSLAHNEHQKGVLFERFIMAYLQADPVYANEIEAVWRYPDWPERPSHWRDDNLGIDLVAKTHAGEYWAIQCKFYQKPPINKEAVTSFTSDSQKVFSIDGEEKSFSYRLFISTLDDLGREAEEALQDLPQLGILYLRNLELAPIDWSQFTWDSPERLTKTPGKSLRPHQREAVLDVLQGFQSADRGKLIMACGTGKTFTSLQIMQQLVPGNGLVLFLAPSITLVSQTLREWCDQANPSIHAFVVCSDSQVGQEEDLHTPELAYPATTDPVKIAKAIGEASTDRRRVVFATYQSIQRVIEAQQLAGLPDFDLVVCDEAHRTTGLTIEDQEDSEFVKVHRQDLLRAKKRLYMTATPRIYSENTKTKAQEKKAVVYSMDDEAVYGPEFHVLTFGEAASRGILAEYKVILVAVREEAMADLANQYNAAYKLDDKKAITSEFATRIIGAWKGLSNQEIQEIDGTELTQRSANAPMKRAVAFARSIKASEQLRDAFGSVVALAAQDEEVVSIEADLRHVDGSMNMGRRTALLDWLKDDPKAGECRVLTNARCLSEGVDVPALDAVIFFDARDSMVDIVQAVGRVMRKAEGKKFGYVILPIAIPSSEITSYDTYIDRDPRFKAIWKVLKALRAHDERLVDKSEYQRRMTVLDGGGGSRKERKQREGQIGDQIVIDLPPLPVDEIRDALYAVVPKHLGDSEYWASWAEEVAQIAEKIIVRIEVLLEKREGRSAFNVFLKALRKNVNAGISESEAVEMLAQHVITRPIFDAMFGGYAFSQENPVSQAMQRILDVLDKHEVDSEAEKLDRFYKDVAKRVSLAKSDESRQDLIRNLYDTFFKSAFPDMAERLGIVYTPVEVVDFILHSANDALQKHFGRTLSDENVQILDPFTGTGTFLTRLLQSDLIDKESLARKYGSEIHANEIVLLAYYIAAINIESAFHAKTGEYRPFEGIVLTDTFQMYESLYDKGQETLELGGYLQENSARVERQRQAKINVIFSNPPYSAGQRSQNDGNQNQDYPRLDERIRLTYAAQSSSQLVRNLYDSYIRAIRLASDRIGDQGIVGFVTNGSFIDANNMDGLRKCLTEDFSHLYVFNLRGNARTQGEQRRKEGGGIFDSGSRTPVAITIMVKDPKHAGPCEFHYYDIGDYLTREEKLAKIRKLGSIDHISWQKLTPNAEGDWLDQRNKAFESFIPLGEKGNDHEKTIFSIYSLGVVTNRDAWAYNLSKNRLESNMQLMIDTFNHESRRYELACAGLPQDQWPDLESVILTDPKKISWTRSLKAQATRAKQFLYEPESVTVSMYRPFTKQWLYFNRQFNEMVNQMPRLFPTTEHRNLVIEVSGIGAAKQFSALVTSTIPNLHMHDTGQCFPLYWYESAEDAAKRSNRSGAMDLFAEEEAKSQADEHGYIRHEAITDWALQTFRERYTDTTITKEDIFWYVYGLLHSPEYRERFAADLKKMLPRIPLAPDFWAFSQAGRKLGELHLNYETVEPWPLEEKWAKGKQGDYQVDKIRFAAKKTKDAEGRTVQPKDAIAYNHALTLAGIPEEAYEYVVNGKTALEWIMERYSVRVDKDSGIVNDPNIWCKEHDDPAYIVNLIKRIVRVSLETREILHTLSTLPLESAAA